MNRIAIVALLSALALPALASKDDAPQDRFKIIHVADLAASLKSSQAPVVCDANTKATRKKYGVIPGAILLTSSSKFNVAKVLPADKKAPLVFYCANTMCMASHQAANRAMDAGYTDVSVMADGIFGWAKAGQPTSKYAPIKKAAATAKS